MVVEVFLRGCREKSVVRYVMDMEFCIIYKVLKFVKIVLVNDRVFFGGRVNVYYYC